MNIMQPDQVSVKPVMEPLEARLLLSGTSYLVTSLADNVATDSVVTLREAIEAANTNSAVTDDVLAGSADETDIITFDQAALSAEAGVAVGEPLTIILGGTELQITDDLEIQGLGDDVLTINANGQSRVFHISGAGTDAALAGLTITGGSAAVGGGIYNIGAALTLTGSTVSDSSASISGGGIYNSAAAVVTLTNSTISDNWSDYGGGIYNSGTFTLTGAVTAGNWAYYGGGIYNSSGTLNLTNSMVLGNLARGVIPAYGGGIYNASAGAVTLTNSTVTRNFAGDGGAMYNYLGAVTLNNTIVALNVATDFADIHGAFTGNSSMVGGEPLFVRNPSAGVDGVWGTADDDHGDLQLQATSPAIDTGNNALLPYDDFDIDGDDDTAELLPIDLAGNSRVIGLAVDMGAFEFEAMALKSGDADGDGDVDLDDFGILKSNFGSGTTWAQGDFDSDGDVDLDDFGILKNNFGTAAAASGQIVTTQETVIQPAAAPVDVESETTPTITATAEKPAGARNLFAYHPAIQAPFYERAARRHPSAESPMKVFRRFQKTDSDDDLLDILSLPELTALL